MLKCVGCINLHQDKFTWRGKPVVVYDCHRDTPGTVFPYACALSGLFRATSGIVKAVEGCPKKIDAHCILCGSTELYILGENWVYICAKHEQEWVDWGHKHPDHWDHIAPKGRLRNANWVEVFREFIESQREKRE